MTSTYRQKALDCLGEDYASLLDAIAEKLHNNDSYHLHDNTKEVDFYCWYRAELALVALREHDFLHVVHKTDDGVPQDTGTVPYGWALWHPTGKLYYLLRADQVPGFTDGWDAILSNISADPAWRTGGWHVDPVTEDDYRTLDSHKLFFEHPGSRDEFLAETRAITVRAAQGLPPVTGYAAWADDKLIAAHPAVRGLNGWHSLGMGDPADHVSMLALYGEEYQQLTGHLDLYRGPGGQEAFLAWRHRSEPISDEEADTNFSSLAHAFCKAIFKHGDGAYGGTPHLVLGQYLENCLRAYSIALSDRQEYGS